VRIDSDQQITAPARQAANSRTTDKGFASTLAAARDTNSDGILPPVDPPAERPPAERWGQYGPGATAAGYGPPPDPATFSAHPTGTNAPAHPLNPSGNTTSRPPFTVPGFTPRGTPIPPGFYNLAYYNQYLAEGGTPLVGFPEYRPEVASLAETYGQFGDGRERATSYVGGLVQPNDTTAVADASTRVAAETAPPPPAPASAAAAAPASANAPARTAPAAAPVQAAPATTSVATNVAVTPAVVEATGAERVVTNAETLLANATRDAARLALQSLLDDLLSRA
jgi:hypothetical protein